MRVAETLAVLVTVSAALLANGLDLAHAATPQIAFSPSSSTAQLGADIPVDITAASVASDPGLGGYDVTISFNPSVVHVSSLSDTGLVTQGQNIVICNPATIDNVAGTANATCGTLPLFGKPGVGVAQPVPLLHAVFAPQADGTTDLRLDGSTLEDPSGANISAALGAGSITVGATPTPRPPPASSNSPVGASPTSPPAVQSPGATPPAPTVAASTGSGAAASSAPASGVPTSRVAPPSAPSSGVGLPSTGDGASKTAGSGEILALALTLTGVCFALAGACLMRSCHAR